jgi:hypothetical protein
MNRKTVAQGLEVVSFGGFVGGAYIVGGIGWTIIVASLLLAVVAVALERGA